MVTAHHEAAHAVASAFNGGTIYQITLDKTEDTLGGVIEGGEHGSFVAYAGPWAEVRLSFGPPNSGPDDFNRHLRRVFSEQDGDAGVIRELTGRKAAPRDDWNDLLESAWPAIQRVAAMLLAGVVGVEDEVRGLLGVR